MWWAMLAQMGASMIANYQQQGQMDKAQKMYDEMAAKWGDLVLPTIDKHLQNYEQDPSYFEKLQENPENRAMQKKALDEYANIVANKGNDAQFERAIGAASRSAQGDLAGNIAEAQRGLAARGPNNAGASAIASIVAAQRSAETQAQMADDAAAQQNARYLQALNSMGGLAGQIRSQDYTVQSNRAQAMDERNRFNAGQRVDAQKYANDMAQRQFENELRKLTGASNAKAGQATNMLESAKTSANNIRTMGAGASQMIAGMSEKYGGNDSNDSGALNKNTASNIARDRSELGLSSTPNSGQDKFSWDYSKDYDAEAQDYNNWRKKRGYA